VVRYVSAGYGSPGVVGPDQGPTPPDLSSFALSSSGGEREREREREREPGIRKKNFVSITPRERSSAEVSRQVAKLRHFLYIPHVIAASMNISTYN
jgi:hypothetical protein